MESPVFILGSHKSGTSLMRNLLDGVTGFFVIPIEAHFFEYSGFWVDYALRRNFPKDLTFEQVLKRIVDAIQVKQDSRWCLMDAGHLVVNILSREGRDYYRLDSLWGDAPALKFQDMDD